MSALLHVLPPEEAMQAVVELRLPNRLATGVVALSGGRCALDERGPPGGDGSAADIRRWIAAAGRDRAPLFLDLWRADARHQGARTARRVAEVRRFQARVAAELKRQAPLAIAELALGGKEVMELLPGIPGKQIGEALRHCLEVVLEEPAANTEQRLSGTLRAWWAAQSSDPGSSSRARPGASIS
jgi:hypothetical protein